MDSREPEAAVPVRRKRVMPRKEGNNGVMPKSADLCGSCAELSDHYRDYRVFPSERSAVTV